MFTFTCSVGQYALCMYCTWLLYILNDNNVEIDVRPNSSQMSEEITYIVTPTTDCFIPIGGNALFISLHTRLVDRGQQFKAA